MSDLIWGYVNTPEDLGRFLRDRRLALDLTQETLAEDLGTTRQYVHDLESGRKTLYISRLFMAMRMLGIRLKVETRP